MLTCFQKINVDSKSMKCWYISITFASGPDSNVCAKSPLWPVKTKAGGCTNQQPTSIQTLFNGREQIAHVLIKEPFVMAPEYARKCNLLSGCQGLVTNCPPVPWLSWIHSVDWLKIPGDAIEQQYRMHIFQKSLGNLGSTSFPSER